MAAYDFPLVVAMLKCWVFVFFRLGLPTARSAGRLEIDLELVLELFMDLLDGGVNYTKTGTSLKYGTLRVISTTFDFRSDST